MDKTISARISESAASQIEALARRLHTSKKCVLERAIEMYAEHVNQTEDVDAFEKTCGTWRRKESAAQIVKTGRQAFHGSMERRQR